MLSESKNGMPMAIATRILPCNYRRITTEEETVCSYKGVKKKKKKKALEEKRTQKFEPATRTHKTGRAIE